MVYVPSTIPAVSASLSQSHDAAAIVLLNVLGCRLTYYFISFYYINIMDKQRHEHGSILLYVQDGHLDFYTAPEH